VVIQKVIQKNVIYSGVVLIVAILYSHGLGMLMEMAKGME